VWHWRHPSFGTDRNTWTRDKGLPRSWFDHRRGWSTSDTQSKNWSYLLKWMFVPCSLLRLGWKISFCRDSVFVWSGSAWGLSFLNSRCGTPFQCCNFCLICNHLPSNRSFQCICWVWRRKYGRLATCRTLLESWLHI